MSNSKYLVATVVVVGVAIGGYALRSSSQAADQKKAAAAMAQHTTQPTSIRAEGRVTTYPGATVDVSTETGGRVAKIFVQEEQRVHRGDVIAEIAADEQRAALAEARARVSESETNITFLTGELQRIAVLAKTASVSKQSLDKATRDLDAARAQREVAIATVNRIDAQLAKTRIVAPIDGTVTIRYTQTGETVAPGTRLVTIADLTKRRVEAEIDEFDAGRVTKGAPVMITAEGYNNQTWKGTVEVVPDVVVGRQLKPQDPSRPSDTRVLLTKITLPSDAPLKLGQRVEVAIEPETVAVAK